MPSVFVAITLNVYVLKLKKSGHNNIRRDGATSVQVTNKSVIASCESKQVTTLTFEAGTVFQCHDETLVSGQKQRVKKKQAYEYSVHVDGSQSHDERAHVDGRADEHSADGHHNNYYCNHNRSVFFSIYHRVLSIAVRRRYSARKLDEREKPSRRGRPRRRQHCRLGNDGASFACPLVAAHAHTAVVVIWPRAKVGPNEYRLDLNFNNHHYYGADSLICAVFPEEER